MSPRTFFLGALLLVATGCTGRQAAYRVVHSPQPEPVRAVSEPTVLEVETPKGPRRFTMRQLEALRAVEYRTVHAQLKQAYTYEGVLLSDLARATGIANRDLRFTALNKYSSVINADDYMKYPILLAYRADGKPIRPAQKGPLTVVLPTHAYPRFTKPSYGRAWVWYVARIEPQ